MALLLAERQYIYVLLAVCVSNPFDKRLQGCSAGGGLLAMAVSWEKESDAAFLGGLFSGLMVMLMLMLMFGIWR